MMSTLLQKARKYEKEHSAMIPDIERPAFHMTGGCGWINDPNGFSLYKGEYHLFYQYHPFSNSWGSMHWGHARSKDMVSWERLPLVMAPDEKYDDFGCFSGSAIELGDGSQLLMYTGVEQLPGGSIENPGLRQTQCLAVGDGVSYRKYSGNPVLCPEDVPGGCRESDFRDPKIWKDEDGFFYAVMSSMKEDQTCRILLFRSEDAVNWSFLSVLSESTAQLGGMWECPDFFPLDGKYVLLVSPMTMMPMGKEFHPGHSTLGLTGTFDKNSHTFVREFVQPIDSGIDFYAAQSLLTSDGRRVMIAWMQSWPNSRCVPPGAGFFGQLSLPRELEIRNGRLIQNPVRELLTYRQKGVFYENVSVAENELTLPDVNGRVLDMTVTVKEFSALEKLTIRVAADDTYHTDVTLIPKRGELILDRTFSGYLYDIVHKREIPVEEKDHVYKLRLILDRYSLEVFVNDGERAGTLTFFTSPDAERISFHSEGRARIDVEKYDLAGF